MGRRTVSCSEKHTPLNPAKDRVRRNWIRELSPESMVVTISHGALGVLDILGHQGPIQVVDIDKGVIESTEYMRKSDYKELQLRVPAHTTIQNAVRLLATSAYNRKLLKRGAIDVDLADVMTTCFPILEEVLMTLVANQVHTTILFTFRNGRDSFSNTRYTSGTAQRLHWLKSRLPAGVSLVSHEEYNSLRITENAARKCGSAMCIVKLST